MNSMILSRAMQMSSAVTIVIISQENGLRPGVSEGCGGLLLRGSAESWLWPVRCV